MKDYVKIGNCVRKCGEYLVSCEYNADGLSFGTYFKDEEAYEKNWNAPCYTAEASFDHCDAVDDYYTHKQLLELCNYNEEICDVMFQELNWMCPETWLHEFEPEDFAPMYQWLKVGSSVFYLGNASFDANRAEPENYPQIGWYKITQIFDAPEAYSPETEVFVESTDGSVRMKVRAANLCKDDIYQKIRDKEAEYYHSFIYPDAFVYWEDPALETSAWYYVDSVDDNNQQWNGNTMVWLKQYWDDEPTNHVLMDELFPKSGCKIYEEPEATLCVHDTSNQFEFISRCVKEEQYCNWFQDVVVPRLELVQSAVKHAQCMSEQDQVKFGNIIDKLRTIKIQKYEPNL